MRERRRVERVDALHIAPKLVGDLHLSLSRAIGELRTKRRSRAVSIPNDVAPSGRRRSRLLPASSSNASAPASVVLADGGDAGSRLQADSSGSAAADASAVMASRRSMESFIAGA